MVTQFLSISSGNAIASENMISLPWFTMLDINLLNLKKEKCLRFNREKNLFVIFHLLGNVSVCFSVNKTNKYIKT